MPSDPRRLPRAFTWLWGAYAVSTLGTWFAFDAVAILAVRVLHAGPAAVSALAAAGPAVGAVLAVPTGPWVEFRRKRSVMVGMDLLRAAALLSIPFACVLGALSVGQLALVSITVGAADIAFKSAAGARVKAIVPRGDLLRANGRLESTMWTATVLGPPLGGAAIALVGSVVTVVVDAVSYVVSAAALLASGPESRPELPERRGLRPGDLLVGWRDILANPVLRPLFFNAALVNALIMATAPLMAVLMLGRLHFPPWQYGLAFGAPCVGGLLGSRLSARAAARLGRARLLRLAGTARVCWPLGLALVRPGVVGLLTVLVVQFGLVTCIGLYNPLLATVRLEATPADRVARTLSAWSVTTTGSIAVLTAVWGLLAGVVGPRGAVAAAGALMLATPLLLRPRRTTAPTPAGVPAGVPDLATGR